MPLLGVLLADQSHHVSAGPQKALLQFNPTDAYRILNLSGSTEIAAASGMAGSVQSVALAPLTLIATLAAWVAGPMALAALAFSRREL
jgi:Cu-processing system permease protein